MFSRSNQTAQLTDDPVPKVSLLPRLPEPIGLVRRLADGLDVRRVKHCHWKGTFSMASVLAGEKDIDLLVDSDSTTELRGVLTDLGFKPAQTPADRRATGESHYFGYDEATGRIVHLHIHDRIVLGDSLTRRYRLPVEQAYLASAGGESPFPLPQVEYEFVLFVLRMLLEQTRPSWRRRATCPDPPRDHR